MRKLMSFFIKNIIELLLTQKAHWFFNNKSG